MSGQIMHSKVLELRERAEAEGSSFLVGKTDFCRKWRNRLSPSSLEGKEMILGREVYYRIREF